MPEEIVDESYAEPTAEAETDEAYGGPDSLAEDAVVGVADLNPKTFDMALWLSGVQPVRRSHTMYARADLLAQIDELAALEQVTPAGEANKALLDEAVALTDQIKASGITFVIEGKTATWEAAFRKSLDDAKITDTVERSISQLVAQIVEPVVAYEDMAFIAESREPEVAKMLTVLADANHRPVILNPRFLRGASA